MPFSFDETAYLQTVFPVARLNTYWHPTDRHRSASAVFGRVRRHPLLQQRQWNLDVAMIVSPRLYRGGKTFSPFSFFVF